MTQRQRRHLAFTKPGAKKHVEDKALFRFADREKLRQLLRLINLHFRFDGLGSVALLHFNHRALAAHGAEHHHDAFVDRFLIERLSVDAPIASLGEHLPGIGAVEF